MPPLPLWILRTASAFLRRFFPFLWIDKTLIVTRHKDVKEILHRDSDFTIAPVNGPTISDFNGPFILAMDCPEYAREASILRRAIGPDDPSRIYDLVSSTTESIVERARPGGSLDFVADLSRVVPLVMVDKYFGVPAPDGNDELMKKWMRTLFQGIFLNLKNKEDIREKARVSFEGLSTYLDELIEKRTGAEPGDDFLGRLIEMQQDEFTRLDNHGVRRNISGVIVGAVDTTSKTAALILDQLLKRPRALEACRQAAEENDLTRLGHLAREALRFNPHNPIILRECARDTAIGSGLKTRKIKAGTKILAVTLSAMFDSAAFPDPSRFRTNRQDANYLHFGYGLHSCFGQYINEISIPAMLAPVVKLKHLKRGVGSAGSLKFDGPFPNHLRVEFTP